MEEKKVKGIFYAHINYYDECFDKNKEASCVILASSYDEACRMAVKDFKYVNKVYVEAIVDADYGDCSVIYIDNDGIALQKIREENDF